MALAIFWSKKADKRFEAVIEYIEKEWGTRTASLFVKKVYDFLDILSEYPEIGSLENRDLNIRGFVIVKQLTIFYQLQDNKIVILNFYDNRQKKRRKRY
jgi:plasmid stabilization system protein ParE